MAIAQCLNRTCDQLIVGRNLPYSRVTRIILSQEYLDAADLDAIRRRGNTYTNYVLFWSLCKIKFAMLQFQLTILTF